MVNQSYFMNAKDVAEVLQVSISRGYLIIRQLNEELANKGFRIERGKIVREYFLERYGCQKV